MTKSGQKLLTFEILSCWQVGSGAGEMGIFDSRPMLDTLGLPVIPGRQVKGLCRQAVQDAEALGLFCNGSTDALFGTRADPGAPLLDAPTSALLRFDDARLPEADRNALSGNSHLIAGLFITRRSTAMTDKGVAKPKSLRFDQVVIPLTLETRVTPLEDIPDHWVKVLRRSLPLLNAIGSGRTRGMGRVIVRMGEGT